MAKATIRYVEREKVVTERVEDGVTLELSSTEAEHLTQILGGISGGGSVRDTVDKLWDALIPIIPEDVAVKSVFKSGALLINPRE